jgi:transcriptional regulator with XRE-family HTH domain
MGNLVTPERLAKCIAIIGWTQRETGRQLGRQEAAIRQYLSGKLKMPNADALWIEKLARFHERNPAPRKESRS